MSRKKFCPFDRHLGRGYPSIFKIGEAIIKPTINRYKSTFHFSQPGISNHSFLCFFFELNYVPSKPTMPPKSRLLMIFSTFSVVTISIPLIEPDRAPTGELCSGYSPLAPFFILFIHTFYISNLSFLLVDLPSLGLPIIVVFSSSLSS
jgi:hypothetical protein